MQLQKRCSAQWHYWMPAGMQPKPSAGMTTARPLASENLQQERHASGISRKFCEFCVCRTIFMSCADKQHQTEYSWEDQKHSVNMPAVSAVFPLCFQGVQDADFMGM